MGTLLGHRQGGRGGGGGEGKHHGRKGALKELDRADAYEHLGGQGVDDDCVDDVADVGAQDNQRQGAQNVGALGGGDPRHVGEHADGGQGDDKLHQLLNNGVEGADDIAAQLALLSGNHDGAAEEQGDHDDLKHVGVDEGLPHVAGEDVHQNSHKAVEGLGLILRRSQLGGQVGEQARPGENVGEHQSDDTGDSGGHHEVNHSLDTNGANLLHVAHGQDAVDHGEQHHGHHDKFQQVDEDVAEGLEVVGGKLLAAVADKGADQSHDDTGHQCDEDTHGQVYFLFHSCTLPLLIKISDLYPLVVSSFSWCALLPLSARKRALFFVRAGPSPPAHAKQ